MNREHTYTTGCGHAHETPSEAIECKRADVLRSDGARCTPLDVELARKYFVSIKWREAE